MTKKIVDCAAFILLKEDQILIEKRELSKKTDPGKVAIPSGHVDPGENILGACRREMLEELNVKAKTLRYLTQELHDNGLYHERMHYFICTSWKGEIQSLEAEEVYWIGMKNIELLDLETDRRAISKLLKTRFLKINR
ncbi:NUDIX domain-containing protein [Fulvivirgaceae bacterium BMA10]|uniref:8-oxo-dGTP diphosphatase n=1 Tax=Splendidivirga corallicola TaxID=3051826 RepID=A0ABT8KK24_9BACT|nr:NUDIX domain-containing protein [Fulvivirgaceae bacterium BMA10]